MPNPVEPDLSALFDSLRSLEARRQSLRDRLRAIDERKSMTVPHIYEKVRRETLDKLSAVDGESEPLRQEAVQAREAVASQYRQLEEDAAHLGEELEELRFRNSLGEFTPDQFEGAERAKLAALEDAQARLQPLANQLALLDSFVAPPPPPPPEPAVAAVAAAAAAAPVTAPVPTSHAPDIESLFGSAPPPPPPPPRPSLSVTDSSPRPPAGRTAPHPAVYPEETTQDLDVKSGPTESPFARGTPAPAGVFRPVLIVKTKDKDRGEDQYDLPPGQTLIGRAPENDIILLEESVSRRHARMIVEGGECLFEDLGSANGSYVNGERVRPKQPRKLQDNDVVKMGQLLALFRMSPEE